MAKGPIYRVKFRRRREGKTDYYLRRKLLSSGKPRLVIRRSTRYITIQLISPELQGDRVIVSAHSSELKKLGYRGHGGNRIASYLTGLLLGRRALSAGCSEGILDLGLQSSTPGNNIYSAVRGCIEAGFKLSCWEQMLPSDELLSLGRYSRLKQKILHG